jgi:hypothetical protein
MQPAKTYGVTALCNRHRKRVHLVKSLGSAATLAFLAATLRAGLSQDHSAHLQASNMSTLNVSPTKCASAQN